MLRPELLLCPRVPVPLHGRAPRTLLGSKWWYATRQAAYKSTAYHCAACGVWKHRAQYRQWLEAHEVYEVDYLLGQMVYVETVPLCHLCHNYIHRGRLELLLRQGKITQAKFATTVQHGDRVLAAAGLRKPLPYEGPFADWNSWKLILFDEEYGSKFQSLEEWQKAYGA